MMARDTRKRYTFRFGSVDWHFRCKPNEVQDRIQAIIEEIKERWNIDYDIDIVENVNDDNFHGEAEYRKKK